MRIRTLGLFAVLAMLLLPALGCDSFERSAFRTLSASKAIIDTAQSDYEPVPVGTGKLPHTACVYSLINDAKQTQKTGVDALQTYDAALKAKQDTTAAATTVTAQLGILAIDVPKIKALYTSTSCS